MIPTSYSYSRYLEAKASVDARALHPRVWSAFVDRLAKTGGTVSILEVGGGVGVTVQRVIEALTARPVDRVAYTMIDQRAENISRARDRLPAWAAEQGFEVDGTETKYVFRHPDLDVAVRLVTGDAFAAEVHERDVYDAIIAQAVLDVVPLHRAFQVFRERSHEQTLWYLPIHFNGVTAFEPVVNASLDTQIERAYHASMYTNDEEDRGGPHTGRRLLSAICEEGRHIAEAGGSDWIVTSDEDHNYTQEESYFLHHILHFIESELEDSSAVSSDAFQDWAHRRHQQVEDGVLTYIAHNIDVLAAP